VNGRRFVALVALGLAASALAVVAGVVLLRPASGPPAATTTAAVEGCLACHAAAEGPGGAHATTGCEPCHLGDARATTAAGAHHGMEPEPGALRTAERTCGRCHGRELERVRGSLMATARGLVAVDRWAFGERPTPDGAPEDTITSILEAATPTPAEDHLRRLCAGCHLGTTRDNRDDAITAGASGCSACHAPATPTAAAPRGPHPPVDARADDTRCLGCHSRSARISLGYQGLYEVSGPAAEACAEPVTLHDGRRGCRTTMDVHFAGGMACIDCHVHTELMGDGTPHAHAEAATEVRCESCHGPAPAATWRDVEDPISVDLLRQRGEARAPDEPVRLGLRGTPLWNVRPAAGAPGPPGPSSTGGWQLVGKLDGRVRAIAPTPTDHDHTRPGHERLTCAACHDAWAPRCDTCHTDYVPDGVQWDFAAAALRPGLWRERHVAMGIAPPTLGVDAAGRIAPTMPGMIGTLDARAHPAAPAGAAPIKLRLHAVVAPHTTRREARTCASCHADAQAVGASWAGLFPLLPGATTRTGGRSLDAVEQRRVLLVGACLGCHGPQHGLWTAPFAPALARLARGEAPACTGRPLVGGAVAPGRSD